MLGRFKFNKKIKLFDEIYQNINGFYTSKETREKLNQTLNEALTYGEVEFMSFKNILELAMPRKNEIFYDLGSGTGKAVIVAALCFDFSVCKGIELLTPLYQLSCQALKNLQDSVNKKKTGILRTIRHLPEVKFYNQNFIHADFSKANIIFINATCYPGEFWEGLIEKFNHLTTGSRIIITSKTIHSPFFEKIYSGTHLMSWGMNSVRIYKKIK